MMDNMDAIQLRDSARAELMAIKDIETGFEYLSKVKAIEVWAKAEKKDAELQNLIAEQKIRTQRILGQLIKDGQDAGEIAKQNRGGANIPNGIPEGNTVKTLSDIGLTAKESSTFKQIASIPDDLFETSIENKKESGTKAVSEITTAGMLKVAKDAELDKRKQEAIKQPHVSFNSGENEWYTPDYMIDAVKYVMGNIDLDPASSEIANMTVQADNYLTIKEDGLSIKWFGNVWLNPPYSQPEISKFSDKVIQKEFKQACVLVNNATETNWFQNMLSVCDSVCFIKGRIKFKSINEFKSGSPLQGQALLYFGENTEKFKYIFKEYGIVLCQK